MGDDVTALYQNLCPSCEGKLSSSAKSCRCGWKKGGSGKKIFMCKIPGCTATDNLSSFNAHTLYCRKHYEEFHIDHQKVREAAQRAIKLAQEAGMSSKDYVLKILMPKLKSSRSHLYSHLNKIASK